MSASHDGREMPCTMPPKSGAGNTFIRHGAKHYKASTGLVV